MKRLLIRYKTRPDAAAENRRLIENVFAELQAKSPEGVRYMVLALGDDVHRAAELQDSSHKMWNVAGIEPETLDYAKMEITSPN